MAKIKISKKQEAALESINQDLVTLRTIDKLLERQDSITVAAGKLRVELTDKKSREKVAAVLVVTRKKIAQSLVANAKANGIELGDDEEQLVQGQGATEAAVNSQSKIASTESDDADLSVAPA